MHDEVTTRSPATAGSYGVPVTQSDAAARTITINGRTHRIAADDIGHGQLVKLAYPDVDDEAASSLTVSYQNGPVQASEGLLTSYQRIPVSDGEAFVVARTSAS